MLGANARRIAAALPEGAQVLDVGGGLRGFERATHVLDHLSAPPEAAAEGRTWVQRDVCDREPWPFADGQFDYVVCAQTLEDVRDPVWVCHEIARVGRAGYLEVPSRVAEQSKGVEGPDWAGWSHHHWLCDIAPGSISFTFKYHVVHRPGLHLPRPVGESLTLDECIQWLEWEGTFAFSERIWTDAFAMEAHLRRVVDDNAWRVPQRPWWRQWRG